MNKVPRVIVAHDEPAILRSAVSVVREGGYDVVGVTDGDMVLALLNSRPTPDALVVDVALSKRAGFELIGDIEGLSLGTRVILIASVYSKTAYKRKPTTLYGAHDYVEQHHIIDMLGPKLSSLVPAPREPVSRSVHEPGSLTPRQKRDLEAIRSAGLGRIDFGGATGDTPMERARTVARLLVADMLLYNGDEVDEWVSVGNLDFSADPSRLPAGLREGLEEARRLFRIGVPADLESDIDFVVEAVDDLLRGRSEK